MIVWASALQADVGECWTRGRYPAGPPKVLMWRLWWARNSFDSARKLRPTIREATAVSRAQPKNCQRQLLPDGRQRLIGAAHRSATEGGHLQISGGVGARSQQWWKQHRNAAQPVGRDQTRGRVCAGTGGPKGRWWHREWTPLPTRRSSARPADLRVFRNPETELRTRVMVAMFLKVRNLQE